MDSLWPKIELDTPKTPITILKEQASLLGSSTQNLVTAEIEALQVVDTAIRVKPVELNEILKKFTTPTVDLSFDSSVVFRYAFYLVAPALNHYRYQLFFMGYGIDFYPVFFRLDSDLREELGISETNEIVANTEDEFINILRAIFSSNKTQRIIRAIWAQSEAFAVSSVA